MKLCIAIQKRSITNTNRCLRGVTSTACALLEGSLRADGIFLSSLDMSHICPVHRAETVLPTGTHPYQHKWLQKSPEGYVPRKRKVWKGTGRKSLTSWGWWLQFFIDCYYCCPLVAISLFLSYLSEPKCGFCTTGLGTRRKGDDHLMAVIGYRLQVPRLQPYIGRWQL